MSKNSRKHIVNEPTPQVESVPMAAAMPSPEVEELNIRNDAVARVTHVTGVAPAGTDGDVLTFAEKIASFIDSMKPNRELGVETGVRVQKGFIAAIQMLLTMNYRDFEKSMGWMSKVIRTSRKAKGAFHDDNIFRYFSMVESRPAVLLCHRRFVNLLLVAGDQVMRDRIRDRVDIGAVANTAPTPQSTEAILRYFQVR